MGRVIGNQPVIPVDVDKAHTQESKVCSSPHSLPNPGPSRLAAHRALAPPLSAQGSTLSGVESSDTASLSCMIPWQDWHDEATVLQFVRANRWIAVRPPNRGPPHLACTARVAGVLWLPRRARI